MRTHRPSETNRAKVIALCTNAEHLEIDAKTLRKHYAQELEIRHGNLGRGLPAVSAAKYLLSCRGGYKEHATIEHESADGLSGLVARLAKQCDDRADARERILARIAAINGPPEPSICEADKSPQEGEVKSGWAYRPKTSDERG